MNKINSLKESFLQELSSVKSLVEIKKLRTKYLRKKGFITESMKSLSQAAKEDRPALGKKINEVKSFIDEKIRDKETYFSRIDISKRISSERLDITLPGYFKKIGGRHPVTLVLNEVIDVFITIGFSVEEGPEIETDYYNFEALNIPKNHPARDMQDTFYIETTGVRSQKSEVSSIESDTVLRTHTSPVQIRIMERRQPPLRFIAPGKVYRCDSDISHTPIFHQVEGLMVDRGISFSNLKAVLEGFLHRIFSPDVPVRFRPSFFPFTEPSAEVDIGCIFCKGQGCRLCKGTGWLEILGAGMVNPKVFKNVGYDTEKYTGFAFGMGIERIAMLKYGINDIRLFYESDLRFLRQF